MNRATRALRGAGLAAILGVIVLGSAGAGTEVVLTIQDDAVAVAEAQVEIFLSNEHLVGQTDSDGVVAFQVESGRGFWIEVNGERLAQFFFVDQAPLQIDLATVGTIEWEGR